MDTLIENAVFLHGHLGPFLVLGVRAGEAVVSALGRNPLGSRALVEVPCRRPFSCFVDGFQVATGCTLGKGNLFVEDTGPSARIVAYYRSGEGLAIVSARSEITNGLADALSRGEDPEELSAYVRGLSINHLFRIKILRAGGGLPRFGDPYFYSLA